jgi:ribonucleoside-diphosphate reductase alpha chain
MNIRDKLSTERKKLQEQGLVPDWMSTDGWALFKSKYAVKGEDAFFGRAMTIARTAASYTIEPEYWQPKFFNLIWKGWLSCSTPVLSNTGTTRGMSVSCSGQYVGDSIDEFYSNLRESAILSKNGFGTSGYLGDIRPRGTPISIGGKASGILPVLEDFVTMASKVSQGSNRRGAWAGYVPLSHGDFQEVADYVKKNPDDVNIGWNITDADIAQFGKKNETNRRRAKAINLKMLTGKGYFFFPDKVNRARPEMYKQNNLEVKSSNLCTEITLFQDEDHTYTCVLSSMNLAKRNEWKDTDAIFTATVFLDCIAEDFIQKAKNVPGFEKAVRFTQKGRALGLGVCGFHTYLQQESVPFESLEAMLINEEIFTQINQESEKASRYLADIFGEPEWCKGFGLRNTHRTAIAPTMSTAAIMGGVSQGIEPMIGNVFIADLAGGETIRVNPPFLELIKKMNLYSQEFLKDIVAHDGSIQHRSEFSDHDKLVYRTAFEINQESILNLASQRQPKICQAQSINLFFGADDPESYINKIHRKAFEDENILSLYYIRTKAGVSASSGECIACQ